MLRVIRLCSFVLVAALILPGCGGGGGGGTTQQSDTDVDVFDVYPSTESAPQLQWIWDTPIDLAANVSYCGPFSIMEGTGEQAGPAQEIELHLEGRRRKAIHAPCAGVVSWVTSWSDYTTAFSPNNGGEVYIRYGLNYAVGFCHVVTTGTNGQTLVQAGQHVEAGDIIGYTADEGSTGEFYEILVGRRTVQAGGTIKYECLNPYLYFDSAGQASLLAIWQYATANSKVPSSYSGPTWGSNDPLDDGLRSLWQKSGWIELDD